MADTDLLPQERALIERLQAELARIDACPDHEKLFLPPGADPLSVRRAFDTQARNYHPANFASAAARELATKLCAKLDEAARRLGAAPPSTGEIPITGTIPPIPANATPMPQPLPMGAFPPPFAGGFPPGALPPPLLLDQLRIRAETAERRLFELQYYGQQVLQQLQDAARKAEAAEKLAEELRARAEAAEAQLRAIPGGDLGARVNALEAELKDERTRRRAADWVRSRLRRASDAPVGADHAEYLAALDDVAEGRPGAALERLKKLVAADPANIHYRTALHLTEGFHLQQLGQDAELTARFDRARLVEAAQQK